MDNDIRKVYQEYKTFFKDAKLVNLFDSANKNSSTGSTGTTSKSSQLSYLNPKPLLGSENGDVKSNESITPLITDTNSETKPPFTGLFIEVTTLEGGVYKVFASTGGWFYYTINNPSVNNAEKTTSNKKATEENPAKFITLVANQEEVPTATENNTESVILESSSSPIVYETFEALAMSISTAFKKEWNKALLFKLSQLSDGQMSHNVEKKD